MTFSPEDFNLVDLRRSEENSEATLRDELVAVDSFTQNLLWHLFPRDAAVAAAISSPIMFFNFIGVEAIPEVIAEESFLFPFSISIVCPLVASPRLLFPLLPLSNFTF